MSSLITKCKHCGKQSGEHQVRTHHCPGGRKHRTHGWPWFHKTQGFESSAPGLNGLYTNPAMTAFIDSLLAEDESSADVEGSAS